MTIIDDKVLAEFRALGTCELCQRRCYPLEPHHAFRSRGVGGGSRIDVPENIAGLCAVCHRRCHESSLTAFDVRCVIAKRHGTTIDEINDWLDLILRTPKEKPIPERPWKDAAA